MAPSNGSTFMEVARTAKKRISDIFIQPSNTMDDDDDIICLTDTFVPSKVRRLSFDRMPVKTIVDLKSEEICKYAQFFRTPGDDASERRRSGGRDENPDKISCTMCCATFAGNTSKIDVYKRHAIQHSDIDNLSCLVCKTFKCRKESTMKNHLREAHNEYPTRSTKNTLYSQDLSPIELFRVNETVLKCFPILERQLAIPEESFTLATCQVCQTTIISRVVDIENHLLTHFVPVGNYSCRLCPFTGNKPSIDEHALKKHKSKTDIYKRMSEQDAAARKFWLSRCFPTLNA